jgi:N-acetylmuramoyl-L-alanine amidase
MRICIDPGHGRGNGSPTGARGNGLIEDDIALTLAHKLRWYLLQAGHEVVLTRPGPAFVPLGSRGTIAKNERCNAFVSIHCNASADPKAHGAESFAAQGDYRGFCFAERLLDVPTAHGLRRRGVKWDSRSQHKSLRVLRDTYRLMPAALIEVGFLTNCGDAALLRNTAWQDRVAAALAKKIDG